DLVAAVDAEQLEEMSKANLEAFPPPPLPMVFKPVEPSLTTAEKEQAIAAAAEEYIRATEPKPASGAYGCLQVTAYGTLAGLLIGGLNSFFGPFTAMCTGGLIFSLMVFRYLSMIERR